MLRADRGWMLSRHPCKTQLAGKQLQQAGRGLQTCKPGSLLYPTHLVEGQAGLQAQLAQDALAGDGLTNQRCTGQGEASAERVTWLGYRAH